MIDKKAARRAVACCAALLFAGCATATGGAARLDRLAPELRQVLMARPDSVVPVLVQLTRPTEPGDREQLARLGLVVGSVQDRVATGRIRASDLRRLTGWSVVAWVELSHTLRTGMSRASAGKHRC